MTGARIHGLCDRRARTHTRTLGPRNRHARARAHTQAASFFRQLLFRSATDSHRAPLPRTAEPRASHPLSSATPQPLRPPGPCASGSQSPSASRFPESSVPARSPNFLRRQASAWAGEERSNPQLHRAMAAPDLSTNLQEEATCAICLDYFTDPVMTDCGHNFCRECIRRCWGQPEGPYACPECRELSPQRNLRPNRPLAKMAEMARRLHPPSPVPQGVCAVHREPLAAFCTDELRLLCAACERSGEHWAHRVRPVQDAAEDLKVCRGDAASPGSGQC